MILKGQVKEISSQRGTFKKKINKDLIYNMKILKTKIRNTMSQQNLCGQFVLKIIIINETKTVAIRASHYILKEIMIQLTEIHPHQHNHMMFYCVKHLHIILLECQTK